MVLPCSPRDKTHSDNLVYQAALGSRCFSGFLGRKGGQERKFWDDRGWTKGQEKGAELGADTHFCWCSKKLRIDSKSDSSILSLSVKFMQAIVRLAPKRHSFNCKQVI